MGWLWKLLIWLAPLGAGVVAFINTSLAGCESFSFGARGRSECFADAGSGALDQSSAAVLLIIGVVWAILFPIGLWFWGNPQVLGSLDPSQDSTPPTTTAKPTGHATEMSKSDRDRYLWIGRRADAHMSEGREHWLLGKHLLSAEIAQVPIRSIDRSLVKQFITELPDELSRKSISNIAGVLRTAFADAIEDALIPGPNPAARVASRPQRSDREMTTWTAHELSVFLNTIDDERMRILYRVLATSGLRRNEALAVSWESVDLDTARITVTRSLETITDSEPTFKAPKTNAGRRQVPLTEYTVDALRHWRQEQRIERMAAGSGWRDHDLVFTDPVGAPLKPDRVSRTFARIVRQLDGQVSTIRLHDLRHTAASHMIAGGVPVFVVSRILGHASAGMTLDTYAHLLDHSLDQAADAVGRALDA